MKFKFNRKLIFKISLWFLIFFSVSFSLYRGWNYIQKNYNNEALAKLIVDGFNKSRRGKLEIKSVEWSFLAIKNYITGNPVSVKIKGLKLYDVKGTLVVDVPVAKAKIFIEPLRKNFSLVFDSITVHKGKIFVEMFDSPDDSGSEIGLLSLFNSKASSDDDDDSLPKISFKLAVNNFDLKNIDLKVDIPSLDADFHKISLKGGHIFYQTESESSPYKFHLSGLPFIKSGKSVFLGKPLDIKNIKFESAYMDPNEPMELHFALQSQIDNRNVKIQAHLGHHGITVLADSSKIADLASKFVPVMNFSEGSETSKVHISITGTLSKPRVDIWAKNLNYQPPVGPKTTDLQAYVTYFKTPDTSVMHFNNITGKIKEGTYKGRGLLDLETGNMYLAFQVHKLNSRLYLPETVGRETPNSITGNVKIRINAFEGAFAKVDWDTSATGGILSDLTSKGSLYYEFGNISLNTAKVYAQNFYAETSGDILKTEDNYKLALKLSVKANSFDTIIKRKNLPSFIKKIQLKGRVYGYLSDPKISGYGQAENINIKMLSIPYVSGNIFIDKNKLVFTNGRSNSKIGKLKLSTSLFWSNNFKLYVKSEFENVPIQHFTSNAINGKINGKLKLNGSPSNLNGYIKASLDKGRISLIPLENLQTNILVKQGNLQIQNLSANLGKAPLKIKGNIQSNGKLNIFLNLNDFLVKPYTSGILKGNINAKLKIEGSISKPMLKGTTVFKNTYLYGRYQPNSKIEFFNNSNKKSAFVGNLLSVLKIQGNYNGYKQLKAKFKYKNINPKKIISSKILKHYGINSVFSGKGDIFLSRKIGTKIILKPEKAIIKIKGIKNPYATEKPVEKLILTDESEIKYDNGKITIHNFRVKGNQTDITLNAKITDKTKLHLKGDLYVGLISYFAQSDTIDRLTGSINTNLQLVISNNRKTIDGTVYFAGNKIYLPNQEKPFILRAGKLFFQKNKTFIQNTRIIYSEEEVDVNGSLDFSKDYIPKNLDLKIDGNLAASMISAFLNDTFYTSKGRFGLNLRIKGKVNSPNINGRIYPKENVMLLMRNGREFNFPPGGNVEFFNKQLNFNELKINTGDGYISLDGGLIWKNNAPQDANLTVNIVNVNEKQSTFEAELSGKLHLRSLSDQNLKLTGKIDVLNAKFTKKYNVNLVDKLLTPSERVSEDSSSTFDSIPWLKNLLLDIGIQLTGDVEIDNNFAQIKLEGGVNVSGKLSEPKLGGTINLNEGTFRIPMLRGNYEIKEGSIDFDRAKLIGHKKNEPYVDILGEMLFIDRLDNEQIINLKIYGFVSQIKLEWSSSAGLTSAQVLTLLMLNRTPDEIRRGVAGGIPDIGGIFEGYVPLDLQLGLTSDAIKLYVDRKFLAKHLILRGNVEIGFMGQQQQDATLTFRLHDNIKIQSRARRRILSEDKAIQSSEDVYQGRVELKYKMNLKGTWKDILGL